MLKTTGRIVLSYSWSLHILCVIFMVRFNNAIRYVASLLYILVMQGVVAGEAHISCGKRGTLV
jgi:hypothetical protein